MFKKKKNQVTNDFIPILGSTAALFTVHHTSQEPWQRRARLGLPHGVPLEDIINELFSFSQVQQQGALEERWVAYKGPQEITESEFGKIDVSHVLLVETFHIGPFLKKLQVSRAVPFVPFA